MAIRVDVAAIPTVQVGPLAVPVILVVILGIYGIRTMWVRSQRASGYVPKPTSKASVWSMTLGIFSVVLGPLTLGIAPLLAIILGIIGLRNVKASHGQLAGTKSAIAGITLGSIFFLLMAGLYVFQARA
ncbi:MAG: DUF4190 domain-containing protein [Actinomycetes bacterium]